MFKIYYNIGGIVLKVISPFHFYAHNAVDFNCEPSEPDYVFQFEQVDNIPKLMEGAIPVSNLVWAHEYRTREGEYLRAFLWNEYYAAVSFIRQGEGVCYYASADILIERAKEGFELLMYLCMEQILLQFQCLVLHSSHIAVNGKGMVFSAPSQTGKSTQAELWRKYADAKVLNGDRSILKKENGIWFVYGCPMCGTSGIHLQGKEQLGHIIMLSQATENTVRQIGGMEAFRLLYPQITVSGWNADFVNQAMNLLNQLITEVPVWYYACTKEADAVAFLKTALAL